MRLRKPTRGLSEANAAITSGSLMRFVKRRHHSPIFLSFFKNEEGATITANADTYRMITDFFVLSLHGIHVNDFWFQQDDGRLISRNGDVNWPPKSCNLRPL